MKVRELIHRLVDMPQDADVVVDMNDDAVSENYQNLTHVLKRENVFGAFVSLDTELGTPKT